MTELTILKWGGDYYGFPRWVQNVTTRVLPYERERERERGESEREGWEIRVRGGDVIRKAGGEKQCDERPWAKALQKQTLPTS